MGGLACAGRGKLQALKQKQAVRRKQPPSLHSTTSLSDFNPDLTVSLSASEQGRWVPQMSDILARVA